ncbi:MAG TPA: Rrf2 family transcriptional regulator [Candidatus Saccharimonadales bacterium]|nr:Rrf2 family transcriptional regulator [Candidatus Saccharimonadales bacterium]
MRLELTRRGDYGVRAMVALAMVTQEDAGAIAPRRLSVRQIAEAMGIPPAILPSVMHHLLRAGLVQAQEGRSGGYALARPTTSISLLDVIEAVEGDARPRTCVLRGGACRGSGHCAVHTVFVRAHEQLRGELGRAKLAEVAPGALTVESAVPADSR